MECSWLRLYVETKSIYVCIYLFDLTENYVTHPAGFKVSSKCSGTFASSTASFITVSFTVKPLDKPPDT